MMRCRGSSTLTSEYSRTRLRRGADARRQPNGDNMRHSRFSSTAIPSLLGFSVGVTFSAVTGSILFNTIAWYQSGDSKSFEEIYSLVPTFPLYTFLSYTISVATNLITGFVSAKFSETRPYFNAFVAGLIMLAWLTWIQFSSPLQIVVLEIETIILWLAIIPISLLGARVAMLR